VEETKPKKIMWFHPCEDCQTYREGIKRIKAFHAIEDNNRSEIDSATLAALDIGIEWVTIPGGSYFIGSGPGNFNEKAERGVTVGSFQMSKTETTVGQYRACVSAGICSEPVSVGFCNWGKNGRNDHPINCVLWIQAKTFAEWIGGRLPTEAEWEYAARSGGKNRRFPWGDVAATCEYAVLNDGSEGCGERSTWPVCSKTNGNTDDGLCDMAGSVFEWLGDCWRDEVQTAYHGEESKTLTCPSERRVVRGGSWNFHGEYAQVTRRAYKKFDTAAMYVGFRPVRSIP